MALEKLQVGLRIAVVQLNCQVAHVNASINTANKLIQHMKADWLAGRVQKPDLVVFPEFALTGYNFKDRNHIIPYSSKVGQGASYEIAQNVSKTFGCITVMGYPERENNSENTRLFNSAIVVGENGEVLFNYRKSFLYHTDEDWGCTENPKGFQQFPLVFRGKGRDSQGKLHDVALKTSIGICMDLSPYRFEAPFNDFEFATFCIDQQTELIICPMAWLHASSVTRIAENAVEQRAAIRNTLKRQQIPLIGFQGELQYDYDQLYETPRMKAEDSALITEYCDVEAPDMNCVNYWILRFLPLLALKQRCKWLYKMTILPMLLRLKPHAKSYLGATRESSWAFKDRNAVLVIANRCGIEDEDTIFSGSSGIYKFNGGYVDIAATSDSLNESVDLLGNLGKGKEGVLLREVNFEVLRELDLSRQ